jgi:hypothetical protein
MKKILFIILTLIAINGFSQKHKTYLDKIVLTSSDTLNCLITLINDNNIFFYSDKDDDKIYFKPVAEVKKCLLSEYSNPEINTTISKRDNNGTVKIYADTTKSFNISSDEAVESGEFYSDYSIIKTNDSLNLLSQKLLLSLKYQSNAGLCLNKTSSNLIAAAIVTCITTSIAAVVIATTPINIEHPENINDNLSTAQIIGAFGGIVSTGFTIAAVINFNKAGKFLQKSKNLIN